MEVIQLSEWIVYYIAHIQLIQTDSAEQSSNDFLANIAHELYLTSKQ